MINHIHIVLWILQSKFESKWKFDLIFCRISSSSWLRSWSSSPRVYKAKQRKIIYLCVIFLVTHEKHTLVSCKAKTVNNSNATLSLSLSCHYQFVNHFDGEIRENKGRKRKKVRRKYMHKLLKVCAAVYVCGRERKRKGHTLLSVPGFLLHTSNSWGFDINATSRNYNTAR